MKTFNIALIGAALLMAAPAFAAPVPAASRGVLANDKDSFTTLIQENEGIPNPDGGARCALLSRPVVDGYGRFLGYQSFSVCR